MTHAHSIVSFFPQGTGAKFAQLASGRVWLPRLGALFSRDVARGTAARFSLNSRGHRAARAMPPAKRTVSGETPMSPAGRRTRRAGRSAVPETRLARFAREQPTRAAKKA